MGRTNQEVRRLQVVRSLFAAATIALLLSWDLIPKVRAYAGELDSGFGEAGKVMSPRPLSVGVALARQADGKLVTAGTYQLDATYWDFALVRFNGDGTVDESFGNGGEVITDFFRSFDNCYAVGVLRDGRIVAAGDGTAPGHEEYDFALACYKPDGSLDTSFGAGGKVLTDLAAGRDDSIYSIAIQRDGRIVVAGRAYPRFGIARYNEDGSLDTTFGYGGSVKTKFPGESASVRDVAVQPDGKIVAVGTIIGENSHLNRFALARYNSDGSLDSTFGNNGKIIAAFEDGEGSAGYAVSIQSDGRIVATGSTRSGAVIARFTSDGSPDLSFGEGGKVIVFGIHAYKMVLQPDGRIVTGGDVYIGPRNSDFCLARRNSDGSADLTFGIEGRITTDFGGDDSLDAILLIPDGRLVAAGTYRTPGLGGIALACYLNDVDMQVTITDAMVTGRKLYVYGTNFDSGAYIFLDSEKQKTKIDVKDPATVLIAKKAGKKIEPGDTVMLQVKNGDGRVSNEFMFKRSIE